MSRLVASGCSCTKHCWPTWPDYLGKHFDSYINVGNGGIDNATIARNVMWTAKSGDTVVVMWTNYARFDTFKDEINQHDYHEGDKVQIYYSGMDIETRQGGWTKNGSLYYDKNFIVNYYHRIERFRSTLDYVYMLQMHSKIVGYKLYNFTMMDWFQGGIEESIDPRLIKMQERQGIDHFYLESNILKLREQIAPISVTHKWNQTGDTHPTPIVNWIWVKDHVAPELGIIIDMSIENQVKLDQDRVLKGEMD
jgi:hypothetical protein